MDAPRRLVYTWRWEDNPEMGETLVTVEFHDRGGSTEIVLMHELRWAGPAASTRPGSLTLPGLTDGLHGGTIEMAKTILHLKKGRKP